MRYPGRPEQRELPITVACFELISGPNLPDSWTSRRKKKSTQCGDGKDEEYPILLFLWWGAGRPLPAFTVERFSSLTYANSKNISRSPPFRKPTARTAGRACKSGRYDEAGSHPPWRAVNHRPENYPDTGWTIRLEPFCAVRQPKPRTRYGA